VSLAKECLAADKQQRSRHAGAVAKAVAAYQMQVRERLRQAELERAAALARADEEQKRRQAEQARADEEQRRRQAEQAKAQTERQRRRLSLWLATAVVALVAGAGAAGWWYQQDRLHQAQGKADLDKAEAAREAEAATRKAYLKKEMTNALDKSEQGLKELYQALTGLQRDKHHPLTVSMLLSDLKEWETRVKTAEAFWQQAQKVAGSNPELVPPEQLARLDQLKVQVTKAKADYEVADELDSIRLEAAIRAEGALLNTALAEPKYEKVFLKKLNLPVREGPLPRLAEQVKGSALCYVLVAALDHWAALTTKQKLAERLVELARLADPDPWRDQVRDLSTWQSPPKLQQLAKSVEPQHQAPPILVLLAEELRRQVGAKEEAALLRSALLHHPADYWLNYFLGYSSTDPGEQAGCFRAALAIRPDSSPAHLGLGNALYDTKDLEGAIACYQKALERDPRSATAHLGLGRVLAVKEDLDGAIACFNKAIEFDPKYALAHSNLGRALYKKEDAAGAIACYEKAIKFDPKLAHAHFNLGYALNAKGDLPGAIACYEKAIELDPNNAEAHYNLGNVLKAQQDVAGAIACYKKALDCNPKYSAAHYNLGRALHAKKDLDGAIACYQKAITLDPTHAEPHCNLGQALRNQGQFAKALKELKIGHELGSKQPGWKYASAKWVKQCEQLLALDQKLAAIQQGYAQPAGAAEQLALATLCQIYKKHFAGATKFYASAFDAAPQFAVDLSKPYRYNAACAAALAAAGQGKDAGQLEPKDKTKLQQQALAWLQADLELRQQQAKSKNPAAVQMLIKQLSRWRTDPDLAGVRDAKELAQLPESQRKEWQALWATVDQLLQQARK
jgi:tetratricopeptide (TPR) repeat protein